MANSDDIDQVTLAHRAIDALKVLFKAHEDQEIILINLPNALDVHDDKHGTKVVAHNGITLVAVRKDYADGQAETDVIWRTTLYRAKDTVLLEESPDVMVMWKLLREVLECAQKAVIDGLQNNNQQNGIVSLDLKYY